MRARAEDQGFSGASAVSRLERTITVDDDAVHDAALAMVIIDRVVLDAAVVPKSDGVGAPAEAAGEFGPHQVAIEIVELGRASLLRSCR